MDRNDWNPDILPAIKTTDPFFLDGSFVFYRAVK